MRIRMGADSMWRVGKSTIAGAGLGVFCAEDVPKGTFLPYFGRQVHKDRFSPTQWNEMEPYIADHSNGHTFIYAPPTLPACIATFVNEAPPRRTTNADLIELQHHNNKAVRRLERNHEHGLTCAGIGFVTTRKLTKGEELLSDYGDAYPRNYPIWRTQSK